jgi:hypothetical protein
MDSDRRTVVAVRPASALYERPRLAAALEEAFPVRLRPWGRVRGAAAVLDFRRRPRPDEALPTFAIAGATDEGTAPEPVRLGSSAAVDRRVRGVTLRDRLAAPPASLDGRESVLAVAGRSPAWTVSEAGPPFHRVRSALPELGPGEVLYRLLSQRALGMVALVHFLRTVTGAPPAPPLRACVVFDDPNLRWRSYGYIDYGRLVAHADSHDYHACMALIPLDAGRPHPATAALFASRPDRLSLVVHGNDHIDNELLAATDDRAALALAAQAMRRVDRFELRSGLRVDRVMMPPHGLCSPETAGALARVGFDALSALHANPWTAEPPAEPRLAGWAPAEFVRGCPIIPRVPLSSSDADLALRAFLDHPLVVYAHHEDVAGGLDPLAEMADRIRRLGEVRWTSMGRIAAANVVVTAADGHATIAAYARRVRARLPDDVHTFALKDPESAQSGPAGWVLRGEGPPPRRFGEIVPVMDRRLEIELVAAGRVDPWKVPAPAWTPWPRLRRLATEARDRWRPLRAAAPAG